MVSVAPRLRAGQPCVQRHVEYDYQVDQRHQRRLLHPVSHANGHGPPRADQHEQHGPGADFARGRHLRRLPPHQPGVGQDQFAPVHPAGQPSIAGLWADGQRHPTGSAGEPRQVRTAQDRRRRSVDPPRPIHRDAVPFFQIKTAGFCGSCHDVFAPNGFRLEDAFSEFKTSPAARCKQQACQDCHMGVVPGAAAGFAFGPAAKVGNVSTPPRNATNHMIIGPDYSIIHPGIYPHNVRAIHEENGPADEGLATMREWLIRSALTLGNGCVRGQRTQGLSVPTRPGRTPTDAVKGGRSSTNSSNSLEKPATPGSNS